MHDLIVLAMFSRVCKLTLIAKYLTIIGLWMFCIKVVFNVDVGLLVTWKNY